MYRSNSIIFHLFLSLECNVHKNITPCVNILYHIVNMKINLIFPFYYLTIQLDSLDIDLCSLDLFQLLCKIGIDIPLYVIGKKQVRRKKVTDSL